MSKVSNLTAVYFKDKNFWVGFVEEIAGVNSQGRTLSELKKNLTEATEMVITANRELAQKDLPSGKIHKENLNLVSA